MRNIKSSYFSYIHRERQILNIYTSVRHTPYRIIIIHLVNPFNDIAI